MSGALGSLVVEVEANVARFQSDMGKIAQIAENRAKQVDNALGVVNNSLKALGAGLVIGLTFEKIRGQIQGAIDSAAGLKDLAERTGGTVEQLSGLVGVAKLSGTATDALAVGIQKLAKTMTEAENGGKTQAAAFAAIGIGVNDLKGLRPDEVFEKISRKQADYADGAGKVAVMQALLGKSGANLLPVMKDLVETGDLQVKTNTAQAEMADTYQKTMRRLEAAQGAVYKTLAIELLPTMEAFSATMLSSAKSSNMVASSVNALAKDGSIHDWAESGAIAVGTVYEAMMGLIKTARAIGGSFQSVAADISLPFKMAAAAAGEGSMGQRLSAIGQAVLDRNKIVQDANARYDDLWNGDKTAFTRGLRERFEMQRQAKIYGGFPYDPLGKKPEPGRLKSEDETQKQGLSFIDQLQRQVEQQERGRFAMLRLEAEQKNVTAAAEPYIRKLQDIEQRNQRIARIVEQTTENQAQQGRVDRVNSSGNDMYLGVVRQAEALDLTSKEQRRLTQLRALDVEVQRALQGATVDTAVEVLALADKMRGDLNAAFDALEIKESSFATGASRAFMTFADAANDGAKNAENIITGALQRTEDALINFAKTGKLSFRDLFSFMAEEWLRQQIRMSLASNVKSFSLPGMLSGAGNLISSVAGFFGFGHKDGLSYVPYDGYPAVLHEGERVLTKGEAASGGGGGMVIDMSGHTINVGQGVSRGEMAAALKAQQSSTVEMIRRRDRTGRWS